MSVPFEFAHLEGADLTEAHLEGAQINLAHLNGARLVEAHLEGVDLRRAIGLTLEQLAHIKTRRLRPYCTGSECGPSPFHEPSPASTP
jgi:Pentapeptide repeats (8 copies)